MLVLAVLVWCGEAKAQHTLEQPDSVLLSDAKEGDYVVRRYRVNTDKEADYAIHYRISSAVLDQKMGDNPTALQELSSLMKHFADTLHRVGKITITGYASPDGPKKLNQTLAEHRAQDFKHFVDQQYGSSHPYTVTLESAIAPWSAVREKLAATSIAGRDEALQILDGNHTPAEKQAALKRLPAVWHFLTHEALPPLRRVEVDILYEQGQVVETRTYVAPKPTPKPTPEAVVAVVEEVIVPSKEDPCCEELLRSETLGIIVAMPGSEVDY